jgi:hypothetical protein
MHLSAAEPIGSRSYRPFSILGSALAAASAPAPGFAVTSRRPGASYLLYQHVSTSRLFQFLARGWTLEHSSLIYDSHLIRKGTL